MAPISLLEASRSIEDGILRIWIDATTPGRAIRLFGMTLLERLLHGLLRAALPLHEVRVELPPDGEIPAELPERLRSGLPLSWSRADGASGRGLDRALRDASGEPLLAVSADCAVDARLFGHFAGVTGGLCFASGAGEERGVLLRLEAPLPPELAQRESLVAIAEGAVAAGLAKPLAPADFDGYLVALRRHLPPFLFRIAGAASRDRVERFLFASNYKGSTDFLTRYVYPPLVWRAVQPLARRRVHPNAVTAASVVLAFAAVPLFAAGAWLPGLACAYTMSVLDSVDGKLARLTFTYSKLGEILDHGLDIVHPPFWYLAWAYALGGGSTGTAAFAVALGMIGFYVLDRIAAGLFKWRTGVSIHGATPLDERIRTFISRRNTNLALLTTALLLDWAVTGQGAALHAFYFMAAWQAACFAWHASRLFSFWGRRLAGRAPVEGAA